MVAINGVGMLEDRMLLSRHMSAVITARIVGFRAVAKSHCLGGFYQGGTVVGKLCRVEIVGIGGELCWLGDNIELVLCNLVHLLEL